MAQPELRITLASPPDRERLVAEIFFGSDQWAEVMREDEEVEVEFYSRSDGSPWRLPYSTATSALAKAVARLTQEAS